MKRQVDESGFWRGVVKCSGHCGDCTQMWPLGTTEACISGPGLFQALAALEVINKMSFLFFLFSKPQSANSLLSNFCLFSGRERGGNSWHCAWSLTQIREMSLYFLLLALYRLQPPNVEFVAGPRRALSALLTSD